jgi:iron complex transport system substrate-binding protein
VPGGKSYTARAIQDAGGDYLWSENSNQGGIPLDIERVFLKAARADFWINPSGYRSMRALLSADQRFGKFSPVNNDKVYNNTRQVSPSGGNAIWESGIAHPDDVLADLIHIFHPDLMPDHEFVYYERLK